MRGEVLLVLAMTAGGSLLAQERDPWGVAPQAKESGMCLWLPISTGNFKGKYSDELMNAAAILAPTQGAEPAVVITIYGSYFERLRKAKVNGEKAVLTVGDVELPAIKSPLKPQPDALTLAFKALPAGCDAFELTLPCGESTLSFQFRRRSRRLKDAEAHLDAWIEHATSDELRVVSAIQPYLDCDGYRAFAKSDSEVRAILAIRELARGSRDDGLPRFLAWRALLDTAWARSHLIMDVGDDEGVRLALEAWRERGYPGLPKECPGSSKR